jgi:hypothetical protein
VSVPTARSCAGMELITVNTIRALNITFVVNPLNIFLRNEERDMGDIRHTLRKQPTRVKCKKCGKEFLTRHWPKYCGGLYCKNIKDKK